ncbi:MAG: glycosyltransferase family 2 protein [Betaproteobacteria bacterium]
MRVSVIVPCRNEAAFIDAFVAGVLAQRLPAGTELELVVADGASDDGTRARLDAAAARDARVRVVENPERITPVALNRAIAASRGEVIVRMDVHTTYAPDYVAMCAQVLAETGADCVGGAWRPMGEGAIAHAFRSRFGSGGAASRREAYSGPVDTVYLGAWRRDTLLALAGFDEALVRNQDDELALRITRGGGRVWQDARIVSHYTPRESLGALWRQFHQYGYWKVAVIRKHRLPASARHLVPFGFVATLALLALAAPWWAPAAWALLALAGTYAAASLLNGLLTAPAQAAGVALATACMQLGYGLGFARGLLDMVVLGRGPRAAMTRLTR